MSSDRDSQHVYYEGYPMPKGYRVPLFQRLVRTRVGITLTLLFIIYYSTVSTLYLAFYVGWLYFWDIVNHVKLKSFCDWTTSTWFLSLSFIFRYCMGVNVRIFGHQKQMSNKSLIIMNHRCHLDWLYFWLVSAKVGNLGTWTVMLKNILKPVPIVGWAMQYHNFIFLSRRWEKDRDELLWKLSYLKGTGHHYQLLMFPEGTDLTPEHKIKSDEFADKLDLPHYNYCLHPKSTGFLYTMKLLKQSNVESIYDVTVGYPNVFAKTEVDFVRDGRIPHDVHYHIAHYKVSELPDTESGLEEWLRQIWKEKEERLRLFYTHRKFIEVGNTANGSHSNGDIASNDTGGSGLVQSPEVMIGFPWKTLFQGIVFQVILHGVSYIWCWYSWWGWIAGIVSFIFHIYISYYTDGMDYHIMRHYRKNNDFISGQVVGKDQ